MRRIVPYLLLVAACASQPAATPTSTDAATEDTTTASTETTAPSTTGAGSTSAEFSKPVNLSVHDDTIWVVEQAGRVISVDGEVLIDIEIHFSEDSKPESGLLSVAFGEAGYWLYIAWPDTGISELWSLPYEANELGDGTLLRQWGPAPWHFGGGMELHDDWLYLGIGDGAAGAAHADEPQKLRPDRGAILKYHVREGRWEPAANGLRNPWSWTLHDRTLYIGDVGAQDAEEINIAPEVPYPNFGWPIYEGSECVIDGCHADRHTPPVVEYHNEGGNAVVVGGVLDGELVWSDFFTGTIHFTDIETLETTTVETDYQPASLLVHNGEVWVASYDGQVERLEED